MSRGEKVLFWMWTIIVLIVAVTVINSNVKTRKYAGTEVAFNVCSNRYLDIQAASPINISAADSKFFRMIQGKTQLYGVPETPPMDYGSEAYFRLEAQLQGKWEIVEGDSVSIKLTGEEPFNVAYSPTSSGFTKNVIGISLLFLILWFLVICIGVLTTE